MQDPQANPEVSPVNNLEPELKNTTKRKSLKPLVILFISLSIILLIILGGVTALLFVKKDPASTVTPTDLPLVSPTTTEVLPTTIEVENTRNLYFEEKVPQYNESLRPNTLYYGKLNSQNYIFQHTNYDNADIIRYYASDDQSDEMPAQRFQEFTNVVTLYSQDGDNPFWPNGFAVDNDENYVYFSVVFITNDNESYPDTTRVFRTYLSTSDRAILYTKSIWGEETVQTFDKRVLQPEYTAALSVDDLLLDKYLVMRITACYACDEIGPGTVILSDISKGKEVLLPEVGNLQIDIPQNKVSYQEIIYDNSNCSSVTDHPCYGDYVPSGPVLTSELP